MPDILHRVGIDAPAAKVFASLTAVDGLRHWWVGEPSGNARKGGVINFGFCEMKVVEAIPNSLVHWKCVSGPDEWVGTEIYFDLKWAEDRTFILFKPAKWSEAVEFMHHCSTKRATFLLSLRDWLERNEGRPTPHDFKIHVGD